MNLAMKIVLILNNKLSHMTLYEPLQTHLL